MREPQPLGHGTGNGDAVFQTADSKELHDECASLNETIATKGTKCFDSGLQSSGIDVSKQHWCRWFMLCPVFVMSVVAVFGLFMAQQQHEFAERLQKLEQREQELAQREQEFAQREQKLPVDTHAALNPGIALARAQSFNVANLAWMHVGKTGTSFANTIVTLGCPGLADDFMFEDHVSPDFIETHARDCVPGFGVGLRAQSLHQKMTDNHRYRGHWVTMLRQPEQRIISEFHWFNRGPEKPPLKPFAEKLAGMYTQFLNGAKTHGRFEKRRPESHAILLQMLSRAISRLDDDFAFVGLVEEWGLSVCLFHAMFGGDCHPREFRNIRPSVWAEEQKVAAGQYDVTELGGWIDIIDRPVYLHVKALFQRNILAFNISQEGCARRICRLVPEAFGR